MTQAVGMIETRGLVGSFEAADAMVKAANVNIIKQENADGGLITIIIQGDVGAVQAAVDAGKSAAQRVGQLVGAHVIPRPDLSVHDMISAKKKENAQKPLPAENKAKPPQSMIKKQEEQAEKPDQQ